MQMDEIAAPSLYLKLHRSEFAGRSQKIEAAAGLSVCRSQPRRRLPKNGGSREVARDSTGARAEPLLHRKGLARSHGAANDSV